MGYPVDLDEITDEHLIGEMYARFQALQAGLCSYCKRALKSEPQCKMNRRHQDGLEFAVR